MDTISSEEKEKKQEYLKEQILNDSNYNTDDFVLFLEEAKSKLDGADISNWDFDELVQKVEEFKLVSQNLNSIYILKQFCRTKKF